MLSRPNNSDSSQQSLLQSTASQLQPWLTHLRFETLDNGFKQRRDSTPERQTRRRWNRSAREANKEATQTVECASGVGTRRHAPPDAGGNQIAFLNFLFSPQSSLFFNCVHLEVIIELIKSGNYIKYVIYEAFFSIYRQGGCEEDYKCCCCLFLSSHS